MRNLQHGAQTDGVIAFILKQKTYGLGYYGLSSCEASRNYQIKNRFKGNAGALRIRRGSWAPFLYYKYTKDGLHFVYYKYTKDGLLLLYHKYTKEPPQNSIGT